VLRLETLAEQHGKPAVARKGLFFIERKSTALGEQRERVREGRRRRHRRGLFPERLRAAGTYVMQADEIAHAIGFLGALTIEFDELNWRAIAARKHRNKPVNLLMNEVQIGP